MYKYAPKTLDDFDIDAREDLVNPVHHRLLLGSVRTGKTTLANILTKDYPPDCVMRINSLKEQGIQFYRNEVKCFCQTNPTMKKTIVIDGLDELNEQAQQIFINYIDKYGTRIFFIVTGTNPQKIIRGLFSRLLVIQLKPVSDAYVSALMRRVIQEEHINADDAIIPYLMSLTNNSICTLLNYLEKYKLLDHHISVDYIIQTNTNIHSKTLDAFTTFIKQGNRQEATSLIIEHYNNGYGIMDILDAYYTFIKLHDMDDIMRYKLIKIICKYIIIYNNIHEHHIELLFFVEDCINYKSI